MTPPPLAPPGATARDDVFVVGIGNPLREDDRVGLDLVARLHRHFGAGFHGLAVYEADIALAETIAAYRTLLVIDALAEAIPTPYRLRPIPPAPTIYPESGLSSHLFNWPLLLAMARDLFGRAPDALVCGVRAHCFGIGEDLSPQCREDADAAFDFLCDYLAGGGTPRGAAGG